MTSAEQISSYAPGDINLFVADNPADTMGHVAAGLQALAVLSLDDAGLFGSREQFGYSLILQTMAAALEFQSEINSNTKG